MTIADLREEVSIELENIGKILEELTAKRFLFAPEF